MPASRLRCRRAAARSPVRLVGYVAMLGEIPPIAAHHDAPELPPREHKETVGAARLTVAERDEHTRQPWIGLALRAADNVSLPIEFNIQEAPYVELPA